MSVTTYEEQPASTKLPLRAIEVTGDVQGSGGMRSPNLLVVSPHSVNETPGAPGRYRLAGRQGGTRAHLCFVQGHGLYLTPPSMRDLARNLIRMANEMEGVDL